MKLPRARARFSEAIAIDAGLDVTLGATTHVTIGGRQHFGHVLEVQLMLGLYEWAPPVASLEGWTHPYHVIGLVGFRPVRDPNQGAKSAGSCPTPLTHETSKIRLRNDSPQIPARGRRQARGRGVDRC